MSISFSKTEKSQWYSVSNFNAFDNTFQSAELKREIIMG